MSWIARSVKDTVTGKHHSSGSPSSTSGATSTSPPSAAPAELSGSGVTPDSKDAAPEGASADDTEVLDDEPRSMLLSLISQLRIGMDLSKVTLPVFVLEPRSMLERITDFISHADMAFGAGSNADSDARFIAVLRCYLAGWHIKPKGVKKPYNPILGEIFRCRYDYADGTTGYYVAEQVCHHPPVSAFYYVSPQNKLVIHGELRPKSKFLGNSAATIMEGSNRIAFLDRPDDGEYVISMPNMYARGILFGKMVLELGDESVIRNDKTDTVCKVDFKTKGFFSGDYNSIAGKIKSSGKEIGEVTGKWSEVIELKPKHKSQDREILFDTRTSKITVKSVAPESDQEEFESRRLWSKVTQAIKDKDLDAATEAKSHIEDSQRELASQREAKNETHKPRYFKFVGEQWVPDFTLPSDLSQANDAVAAWIYGSSTQPPKATGSI